MQKASWKTTDHKLDANKSTIKLNVTVEPANAANGSNKQDIELPMEELKPAESTNGSNQQDIPDGKEDI